MHPAIQAMAMVTATAMATGMDTGMDTTNQSNCLNLSYGSIQ